MRSRARTRRVSSHRNARTRRALTHLEFLEERQLLASTIVLNPTTHVLTITGSSLNNIAEVNYGVAASTTTSGAIMQATDRTQLSVTLTNSLGGVVRGTFPTASVNSIVYADIGGRDVFQNNTSVASSYSTSKGGTVVNKTNTVVPNATNAAIASQNGVFTVGSSGQVTVDYLYDGGGYTGETAIFSLAGMNAYTPGSAAWNQEAARRALSNSTQGHIVIYDATEGARTSSTMPWESNFNAGPYLGVKTFAMTPGDTFGVMLVPAGTVWEVYSNPSITTKKTPLYSIPAANPGGFDQFASDSSAAYNATNAFSFEDMRRDTAGSDCDYNDVVFQLGNATGVAPQIGNLAAKNRNILNAPNASTIFGTSTTINTLVTPSTTFGASTTTISGNIATYANGPVPTGSVSITVDNVTQAAAIHSDGTFSSSFSTSSLKAGSHTVVCNYNGANSYKNTTKNSSLLINKAAPAISWSNPADITFGTALSTTQLNASASCSVAGSMMGVAGTFTYSNPSGTILNKGDAQTLTVTFTPDDKDDYQTATATIKINVKQASTWFGSFSVPSITYGATSDTIGGTIGSTPGGLIPTGSVSVTVDNVTQTAAIQPDGKFSAVFSTASLGAGTHKVSYSYGGASGFSAASASTNLMVGKATPMINWAAPADIVYGTALSSAQLNASASLSIGNVSTAVAGTFTYSRVAGTVLNAGAGQTLSVTFTPVDATNYSAVSGRTVINVNRAALTVKASDASKTYGASDPAFSVVYSGFVNNDTASSLGGSLSFATDEPSSAPATAGTYAITPSNLSSSNYAITYVAGTLTVTSISPSNSAGASSGHGLLLLDPTGAGALTVTGSSALNLGSYGTIQVDSTSGSAVVVTGHDQIQSSSSGVAGGTSISGSSSIASAFVTQAAVADPVHLALPSAPSTTYNGVNLNGSYTKTLSPGTYIGGIKLSGSGNVTLQPGVYYLQGGGLSIQGNVSVSGTGVVLINAPASSADGISVGGSCQLSLTPATNLTGDYASFNGFALYQDPNSTASIVLSGNAQVTLGGMLYAPKASASLSGSSTLNLTHGDSYNADAVLYDLSLTGNVAFNADVALSGSGVSNIGNATTNTASTSLTQNASPSTAGSAGMSAAAVDAALASDDDSSDDGESVGVASVENQGGNDSSSTSSSWSDKYSLIKSAS